MENGVSQRRFRWALVLAWAPWIPILFSLGRLFIGINNAKATGVAALAGGMAEMLVLWGLVALVVGQAVAIVWLLRAFSKSNMSRNVVSLLSICACGLTLLWLGGFLCITRYVAHR